jgi:CHAT domain-containing protein
VAADQFAGLFARHPPKVVLLQACEGGRPDTTQAYRDVASRIVQHNIPVVVAMQYEISNKSAVAFAKEFYRQLAAKKGVDTAVQEGRKGIDLVHESRDFATPVVFMLGRDGRFFV